MFPTELLKPDTIDCTTSAMLEKSVTFMRGNFAVASHQWCELDVFVWHHDPIGVIELFDLFHQLDSCFVSAVANICLFG